MLEYESYYTLVSLQAKDLSFEDLSSLLWCHEVHLSSLHSDVPSATTLSATKPPSNTSHMWGSFQQTSIEGVEEAMVKTPPLDAVLLKARRQESSQNRPQCKICSKAGHIVIDCHNKLNMTYPGWNSSHQLSGMPITTLFQWVAHRLVLLNMGDVNNLNTQSDYKGPNGCMIGDNVDLRISNWLFFISISYFWFPS